MLTTPTKPMRRLPASWLAASCAALVLAAPTHSQAQTGLFDFKISPSEFVLQADGTDDEEMVQHYEKWDSAIARIRKRNMPYIEVTNSGLSNVPLTEFQMTVGREMDYRFSDSVLGAYAVVGTTTPDVSITSSSPDDAGELLVVSFDDGLMPNETVRFQVDVVLAPGVDGYPYPDYRTVFFDVNGTNTSDNSVLTATFTPPEGDPIENSVKLPNFEQNLPLYINGTGIRNYDNMDPVEVFELIAVPEPAGASLALAGTLLGAGLLGAGGLTGRRRAARRAPA